MASRRKSGLGKMLFGLLALVFGGGTGLWGWIDPEAPVVGALLQKLKGGTTSNSGTASPVLSILAPRDPFLQAGTFEVTISRVTIDPATMREGHHVDVQVKVSKKTVGGQLQPIWDSRYAGDRISLVGRGPIVAEWKDRPFQVAWVPGEDFVVEVWDRKAFFDKTMFLLTTTNGDREFPLRPDTTTFAYLANGRRTSNPAANSIRIDAKRAGDSK
jgi:hypothetical protein